MPARGPNLHTPASPASCSAPRLVSVHRPLRCTAPRLRLAHLTQNDHFSVQHQPLRVAASSAGAGAAGPTGGDGSSRPGKKADDRKMPLQQRVLNGILGISNVPYRCVGCQQGVPIRVALAIGEQTSDLTLSDSVCTCSSYVPSPVTPLHRVDARIKQVCFFCAWLCLCLKRSHA